MILLTSPAAAAIRVALEEGAETTLTSLDLGRSEVELPLEGDRVKLPDGQTLTGADLGVIESNPESIYTVLDSEPEKVTWFSRETNKVYTLRATTGWPALEISGILMHRIKDTDPRADAESKIATVAPVRGRVLETCCGLGYSAIHAAEAADAVLVFEIDPNVVDMARLNPYSRELFDEAGKIELRNENVAEVITQLADASFDLIIHDPPTLAVAGDLYGDDFYRQLFRVLRPRGRLFHYTGDPGSRSRGQDLPGRVKDRLSALGFIRVQREPAALGISARKP